MIEDKEDFFEKAPEEKPKKVKPPKAPRIKPDDPRYYEKEEGRWEHLTPSPYRKGPLLWIVGISVVVLCVLVGLFKYFFSPVISDAVQYGYIDQIQREGSFSPTFEGVLLPYKNLMDSVRPYDGDFIFSTNDEHVAAELKKHEGSGKPVKVGYRVYRFKYPWRGNSKVMVTSVDSVDPRVILPPDRRPEHLE